MTQSTFEFAEVEVAPGERTFTQLPVTGLLQGTTLKLPVHIVNGTQPGPVLGVSCAVHGMEYLPIRMAKGALEDVDASQLCGTLVVMPVCNPLSFAKRSRITPDEDDIDFSNLNRVFPGRRGEALFGIGKPPASDRALTEAIAAVITDEFLPRIDHLIDFHAHGPGAGLIKTIQNKGEEGRQGEITRGMCRALGLGLIHEHASLDKAMTGQAAKNGASTCVPEIGGGGLTTAAEERCVALGVRGILNIMKYLEMMPGEMELPARQLVFEVAPHVRPTTAGYLVSRVDPEQLFMGEELGVPVKKDEVLGTLFNPYTFEELETLASPIDGILYITRRSGPLEAGSHAFAVADLEMAHWID